MAANTQYLPWSLRAAAASTVGTVSREGLGAGGRTGYGRGLPGSETGLTHQGLLKTKTKTKKKKNDINLVPHFGLSLSDDTSFSPLVQTDFKRHG